jgi:hypothetical protein
MQLLTPKSQKNKAIITFILMHELSVQSYWIFIHTVPIFDIDGLILIDFDRH